MQFKKANILLPSAVRCTNKAGIRNVQQTRWSLPAKFVGLFRILAAVFCSGLANISAADNPKPVTITVAAVTQRDEQFNITVNDPNPSPSPATAITLTSVKIGNVDTTIIGPRIDDPKTIQVKTPPNASLGTQELSVTLSDGKTTKGSIVVMPEVLGLRARKDAPIEMSRVVVAGAEVIVQMSANVPSEKRHSITVKLLAISDASGKPFTDATGKPMPVLATKDPREEPLQFTMPQDDYLLVEIPNKDFPNATTYEIRVYVDDDQIMEKRPPLRVEKMNHMFLSASLVLLGLTLFVYALYKPFYKFTAGQPHYTFFKMLLLEQETQTYSLSRAQFFAWMGAIVWCLTFLYSARGFVDGKWGFPNLGNAVYVFMISLGTLVAAQATSLGQGVKGAGEVHPSPSDLLVHGGVLALDRVQQVIWTLIALGMFIHITISTYATASALPEIPTELVALMGLSSAGYLGGKLVRGPGPVINQVTARASSLILNIQGRQFSKEAFVWVDGVQQPKENIKSVADDPEAPLKFAKELEVTLQLSLADWYAKDHAVTIVNSDAQRADWRTRGEIISVTAAAPAQGKVVLTIKGARLVPGATIEIADAKDLKPDQSATDPNTFTATADEAWLKSAHDLTVTSGGQKSTFTYKPAA
jgi:hypothetical protein